MTDIKSTKPGPIEVWLTQKNIGVTCLVANEDETTYQLDVDSLSMRGAQREITGYLIGQDYAPVGRWQICSEDEDDETVRETVRKFRPVVAYPYAVAELDPDGKPAAYLRGVAVKEWGPNPTHRLTPHPAEAHRFFDQASAQEMVDAFNKSASNPRLTVIELPKEN